MTADLIADALGVVLSHVRPTKPGEGGLGGRAGLRESLATLRLIPAAEWGRRYAAGGAFRELIDETIQALREFAERHKKPPELLDIADLAGRIDRQLREGFPDLTWLQEPARLYSEDDLRHILKLLPDKLRISILAGRGQKMTEESS